MDPYLSTVVSAITALVTSSLVVYFTQYVKSRADREQEIKTLNLKYLNPLRLYLEENHFRLNEILKRVEAEGQCTWLLGVGPQEVSMQKAEWFNGSGNYLISSCYFTAVLFYQIRKVKEDFAYLRLGHQEDTRLLNLMFKVSHAFLQNIGIFYVTQPSIGLDLYLTEQGRLRSYREFCELLQDPAKRVWFDRLINFYIETGCGQNLARVKEALQAIGGLSQFLDDAVGGGTSLQRRYQSEGASS